MKLMNLARNKPELVKAAAYVALCIATASAYAFPMEGYEYMYYSDATYTEEVGSRDLSCDGDTHFNWGVETPYRIGSSYECEDLGGPRDHYM